MHPAEGATICRARAPPTVGGLVPNGDTVGASCLVLAMEDAPIAILTWSGARSARWFPVRVGR